MAQTFGKYLPVNSIIHRTHPALKFLLFIITIAMVFIPAGFSGYIILSVWVMGIYFLSRTGWRTLWNIGKSMLVLAVLLLLVNWLTMNADASAADILKYGGSPIAESTVSKYHALAGSLDGQSYVNHSYGGNVWYALTDRAIFSTLYVSVKIFFMIVIASVLTSTTSSLELTAAIEDLLRPLKFFRLPVNEAAMMISIALRFVPSLVDESQRILKAQASRGIDAANGTPWDKLRSVVSLIVPLFSIAFQKADDLANAMEARAYNPRYARTRYRFFKVKPADYLVLAGLVIYLTFMICWVSFGFFFVPFGNPEAVIVMGGV